MSIGIGGAGSKLSSLLDNGETTVVNVSESELNKVPAKSRILAVTHSTRGQFQGSGRNPEIGKTAFISISQELSEKIKGDTVFSSTGGGTGNGITTILLKTIAETEGISVLERTMFCMVLPYVDREGSEFVENTIDFLMDPVSKAIDSGNTGNIVLFSNKLKFQGRIAEGDYNHMMVRSLQNFLDIPYKGDSFELLDGHIDHEDFNVYKSKPYFNHFTQFYYDTNRDFGKQLEENYNNLLLLPQCQCIEAMFLLEVPKREQAPMLYNILDYFSEDGVTPHFGVVLNPNIESPVITVSLLYSRKPQELVNDFKQKADDLTRRKIKKSIKQFVQLETTPFDIPEEVKNMTAPKFGPEGEPEPAEVKAPADDVLSVLQRLRKLK